ncbi:MAG: metalloregulator ArsR/SmtB family transcription factor [Bacilli bacterium]
MAKNKFICDCNVLHQESIDFIETNMLTHQEITDVSNLFKIIGDPTRLKILWVIKEKEVCVCDICNLMDMSKSAISHQLAVLRASNLVTFYKEGKSVFYKLADGHIEKLIDICREHIKE